MNSSHLALAPEPGDAPEPQASARAERPARALIGWMKAEDAHRVLCSSRNDVAPGASDIQRAQEARAGVAARDEGVDQTDLITGCPPELDEYVLALRSNPVGMQMFAEGWTVALVDLTRVCGFQPLVFSDQATERVRDVDGTDVTALAALTLPISAGTELPIQFDRVHQAWTVSSPNPNLRIAGPVGPIAPAPGGPPVLGFAVVMPPSFLQVGRHRGRYFLRDGYHRAFGLLSRGIKVVPAFVRDITAFEELVADPRTMLPQDSYQGARPPVLPDYLDEAVSAPVQVPAAHKLVVIQGLELTPIG